MADNGQTVTQPLLGDRPNGNRARKGGVRTCSVGGMLVMLAYLASAAYYFYIRIKYTLDVGWMWYAYLFLVLELMGSASIIAYASILTRRVTKRKPDDPAVIQNDYVVRVMVPCYKEDLEIIQHTIMAAIEAELPANCTKHVYLCDDGRDPAKQTWCEEVERRWNEGTLHYCRRPKCKGELNGKACNLNYTLKKIYGSSAAWEARAAGRRASGSSDDRPIVDRFANEVIAVFDADMVCKPKFFMKTLPILDTCDMVLTPQWFYNVPMMADIFNHSNLHLWEYMLPAMDGWGCLSCTGTNFVIRAEAMAGVGYFPEYTVTEDYALSLELGRHGYNTRYLNEYLAEGEAPEEIPNIFKQRHRWCTGHIQVFMGKRNPLFYSHLPLRMRLMYSMGAYSYACAAFLTPMFLLAPIFAIWFGVFPIDLNVHYPLAFTIYYGMTMVTIYYSRSFKHLIFLWFASNANLVLWYTYARAIINVLISFLSCGANKIKFEVTDKAGPSMRKGGLVSSLSTGSLAAVESIKVETDPGSRRRVMSCSSLADFADNQSSGDSADSPLEGDDDSKKQHISIPILDPVQEKKEPLLPVSEKEAPRRCCACASTAYTFISNLWVPIVTLLLCLGSIGAGLWLGLDNQHTYHIQMVSIIWCGYNAIAPFLVLYYAFFQFKGLKTVCCSMAAFSVLLLAAVLASLHFYYRDIYDYKEVISQSLMFYEAQRSGHLPHTNRIPWRGNSGLKDVGPSGTSLVGGYYDAGDTVKFGLPAAISMSFLAWGLIEFPGSYRSSGQEGYMKDTLKWGTDYFLKAHTGPTEFIAQVGYGEEEHKFWERPERYLRGKTRVGIPVNETNPGSDVVGSTAAALAAASMVFSESHPKYSAKLEKHAKELYEFGKNHTGIYSQSIPDAAHFYESTSYKDDLAWGALWLYQATSDDLYLRDAEDHISDMFEEFKNDPLTTTDWDNMLNPVIVMLASIKIGQPEHHEYQAYVDKLLHKWMDAFTYTPKKLAYVPVWGVLRETANTAFIAMVHAKYMEKYQKEPAKYGAYECWSMFQLRYMLGDGGRSYVVGYGRNPPTHAHHQGASCPISGECGWDYFYTADPNPHTIYGGLVGGPDIRDRFNDSRVDYRHTEVALDYNAGFTGALAGVVNMDGFGKCYWGGGVFKFFKAVDI